MGANTSRPPVSGFPSMDIRRPGLSPNTKPGMESPTNKVQPGTSRPGIKFGPGKSTRFG